MRTRGVAVQVDFKDAIAPGRRRECLHGKVTDDSVENIVA